MKKLFTYAILLDETKDKDGNVTEEAKILVEPTNVLADSEKDLAILAARQIPEIYLNKLNKVNIAIRPF